MKKNNLGFMLAETLLVTAFVAGVLIYLFLQFYNLNDEYNSSYKYNSVEGLYALEDVVEFIQDDPFALAYINDNISELRYIDISNCTLFTDSAECNKLLKLEDIDEIIVTTNSVPKGYIKDYSIGFSKFINKIYANSTEPYRVIASFNNGTYATLRFNNVLYENIKSPILENGITVVLNPNDGSFNTMDKKVNYNSPYGMLMTPERKGYTFEGWYNNIVKVTSFEDGHKISTTGEYVSTNENYMATPNLVPVRGGVTLYSNLPISAIYSYDSGGNFIRKESSLSSVHPVADNAQYIRIEVRKDAGDFNYYLDNLVINEYQNAEVLEYVNSAITASTLNRIYQNHMLYAKWLPKGATYVRNDHVLANYDMKHRNNNTLIDLSEYNRDATAINGTFGYDYLQFDGSSTWVNLGQINSNNQTLEATIKIDYMPTEYGYIIGNVQGGGGGMFIATDGTIYGRYYINGDYRTVTSVSKIEVGKTYHLALTYDGQTIKLYINGGLEEKYEISGNISAPTNNTVMAIGTNPVGSNAEANYFKGKIYNAAVHDVALDAEQIAIDAETTGLSLEKITYIEDNFEGWSLNNTETGVTYKGIVYLDPTNISRACNAELAAQNVNSNGTPTGVHTGCMKFYIYDDSGVNYKLILDHNTSGNVAWNSDGTTANGYNEVGIRLAEDTQGWIGNPRLITADEIAHIVGADAILGFDEASTTNFIYLDGSGSTYADWEVKTTTASNKSKYAWLYDYTADCVTNGCNVEDNYNYITGAGVQEIVQGYWTSSKLAGNNQRAWRVACDNSLWYPYVNNSDGNSKLGVRPVITIPKVVIDIGSGNGSNYSGSYVEANNTYTYKGIVYLNPKDLSSECNSVLAAANVNANGTPTGIKSGCMKFYIYDETDTDYKMILDHNTSGAVAWNSSGNNSTIGEVQTRLNSDTFGWAGNPRLITADEVAHIVGADNYWYTPTSVYEYFLDGSGSDVTGWQSQVANASNKSRYAWLFDNTQTCSGFGCNIEDNYVYGSKQINGYWTSSPVYEHSDWAWLVYKEGRTGVYYVDNEGYGVRPVITLPKALINPASNSTSFGGTKVSSNSGLLSLGGNGNEANASKKYNVNGGDYSLSFDVYTDTMRTNYTTGYFHINFQYLDSNQQYVNSSTGTSSNGYEESIPLGVWTSKSGIKMGTGDNVKYINVGFYARNDISSLEYKIRNFRIYGDKIPNSFYIIKIHTSNNIGVTAIKYAKGVQSASYFENNGTVVDGTEFRVTENGTYTVYVIDAENNEITNTISI